MACVLSVLMKHLHITDRKGMSPKICVAIYIKAGINIFKACALYKRCRSAYPHEQPGCIDIFYHCLQILKPHLSVIRNDENLMDT